MLLLALAASAGAWTWPATSPVAQTADGLTPAEETVCDGQEGKAFGLCNAYCEAMDCDTRMEPLPACDSVRDNFRRLTGQSRLPCDDWCPELVDATCSGNGTVEIGPDGCEVCLCFPDWSGPGCATCDPGFNSCGFCGFPDEFCEE
jgi:hypothetical protein